MKIATALFCALLVTVLGIAPAAAHWCSNIYQTYSRLVVKPERADMDVAVGATGQLKVWVRNNFPYTLHFIKLRATAPPGLHIDISPDERTAEGLPVVAGGEVAFTLFITREAEGSDQVADLNLELSTSVEDSSTSWRGLDDIWIEQNPDPAAVREHLELGLHQALGLTLAKLADMDCADCQGDGVRGLMAAWGSRIDPCDPGGFESAWAMQFIRAGHQLAVRLRFRRFADPGRGEVVQTMIAAMDDAHDIARGFAAFLAAYGGNDSGVLARIEAMVASDPDGACSFEPSARAQLMAKAALLLLGEDAHRAEVAACVSDGSQHPRVRATCAAALGVMGEDGPITDYLLGQVPDGKNTSNDRLYASYLLQLVVLARRGGPEALGEVTFLDEEPRPSEPHHSASGCATAGRDAPLPWLGLGTLLFLLRRRSGSTA